jgi:hypothetical protein
MSSVVPSVRGFLLSTPHARPDPPPLTTGIGFPQLTAYLRVRGRLPRDEEELMADQNDEDKKNMRIMWIASGLIVLFIIGLMFTIGAPTPTNSPATDMSSQSRTAPPPK